MRLIDADALRTKLDTIPCYACGGSGVEEGSIDEECCACHGDGGCSSLLDAATTVECAACEYAKHACNRRLELDSGDLVEIAACSNFRRRQP